MRVNFFCFLMLATFAQADDLARGFAECAGRFAAEAGFAAQYQRTAFDGLETERLAFESLLESTGGGFDALKASTEEAHGHLLDVAALSFDGTEARRAEDLLAGYRAQCRAFILK